MEKQEQKKLLQKIKKNPSEFAVLYDLYFSQIFHYLLKRMGNYEGARDACSMTFYRAFVAIQKYRWRDRDLLIWLYQIALNEARQYFKSQSIRNRHYQSYFSSQTFPPTPSIEEERIALEKNILAKEEYKALHQALQSLSQVQQDCISLKYFDNLSQEEIAQVLKIKKGTVKSHISRGLKKMAAQLQHIKSRGI